MTNRSKLKFKELTSQQIVLFPTSLDEKIPDNHPVRIINKVVDSLKIDDIISTYKGGGTSSYHPRMMLKVLFYGYFNNLYSCRKIAQALNENIYFMWLAGNNTPDFRTINDFRSKRLKNKIQDLFGNVVKLMNHCGYVSLDIQYIDGTKIESVANKYSFVWRKSVEKNKEKLEKKVKNIIAEIDSSIKEDKRLNKASQEVEPIDKQELEKKIAELNQQIEEKDKKNKKQIKQLQEKDLPRLKRYEKDLKTMGERNSYSKTDPDATFMRMKDDHMGNGQLKPAYNTQISTENQFITNFSLHQRPGDTATLKLHIDQFEHLYGQQSKQVVADAGYGSEENYQYLQQKKIEAYVKYNYFHKEQKKSFKKDIFHPENLYYNQESDFLVCPMGQRLNKIGEKTRTSDLGFISKYSIYQAQRCHGCPLRSLCHKGEGNRRVEMNHRLRNYKSIVREKLLSEEGKKLRSNRAIEPEAVFGQLKSNNKYFRFRMRGLAKIEVDLGLACIAHNLRKMASKLPNNGLLTNKLTLVFLRIKKYLILIENLICGRKILIQYNTLSI